jgi:hypothetical protein
MAMFQHLLSYFMPAKKPSLPVPTAPVDTILECQQQVVEQLKSGQYALSSSDKEGYRLLCCYRQAFLFVSIGDDGTSVLRLPNEEGLLVYLWRQHGSKMIVTEGSYHWSTDLTEAEKLEKWREVLARMSPFTKSNQQFVSRVLTEFGGLAAPQ